MMNNANNNQHANNIQRESARELWNNGKTEEDRVTLWRDDATGYVWAEADGDAVCGEEDLRNVLTAEGMTTVEAARAIDGDVGQVID